MEKLRGYIGFVGVARNGDGFEDGLCLLTDANVNISLAFLDHAAPLSRGPKMSGFSECEEINSETGIPVIWESWMTRKGGIFPRHPETAAVEMPSMEATLDAPPSL